MTFNEIMAIKTGELSEEEADAFCRPKKTNGEKSLACLFLYFILREYSDADHHLSFRKAADILQAKYGVALERRAVSRTLYLMADMDIGVRALSDYGVWYEDECA